MTTSVQQATRAASDGIWRLGALVVTTLGLGGCLLVLRAPAFDTAAGLYVPFARSVYEHPLRLMADRADDFFSIHPPGHAILIAVGWIVSGPSMVVPHVVSLLAAIVVLWATYQLVRRNAGTKAACCALAVILAVPVFQGEARNPTPEMVVAACTAMAVLSLAEERFLGGGWWLAAATLAKETAAFALPLFVAWAVFWYVKRHGHRPFPTRRAMGLAARIALPALVGLVIWLVYLNFASGGIIADRGLGAFRDPSGVDVTVPDVIRRALGRVRQLALVCGLAPVLLAAAVALVRRGRDATSDPGLRIVTLCLAAPVAYLGALSVFGFPLARYIVPVVAPLASAAVLVLATYRHRWLVPAAALCVVLGLIVMWRPPSRLAPTDPGGTLSFQHIIGRDERVVEIVTRAVRNGKARQVSSHIKRDQYSGRSKLVYLSHLERPYLGYADEGIDFVPLTEAQCPYLLISDDRRPAGQLLKRVAPRGGPWDERQSRSVSLVSCGTAAAGPPVNAEGPVR